MIAVPYPQLLCDYICKIKVEVKHIKTSDLIFSFYSKSYVSGLSGFIDKWPIKVLESCIIWLQQKVVFLTQSTYSIKTAIFIYIIKFLEGDVVKWNDVVIFVTKSNSLYVYFSQPPQSAVEVTQPLGSRLAWALPVSNSVPSAVAPPNTRPSPAPPAQTTRVVNRPRRDGDSGTHQHKH